MQNVLKRKNVYLIYFEFIPQKAYVLDHSVSFDMHKEKKEKNSVSAKNRYSPYGGQKVASADISFFTPSLLMM